MERKYPIFIYYIILLLACSPRQHEGTTKFPYTSPHTLAEPIIFAEGKLTTTNGISFSKDGRQLYLSKSIEKKFDNGRAYAGIFISSYEHGSWTEAERLHLDKDIDAYHPVLSKDNTILLFNSRSHPDSANKAVKHNIWMAKKTAAGWGEVSMVEQVNSEVYESYPSIAANGNLYFNSDRAGGKGGMDFYVSKYVNGKYQEPAPLHTLNSSEVENDLVVDLNERFIIFNRYIDSTRSIDLFISFNKGNTWTEPRPLDNINNPDQWELTPSLSPGGKYFFYELEQKIMQIDLSALIYEDELEGVGKRPQG